MDVKKQIAARASKFHEAISEGLHAMTADELRRLKRGAKRLTSTNCWWAAYGMAPHLLKEIDAQLLLKKARKKKTPPNGSGGK